MHRRTGRLTARGRPGTLIALCGAIVIAVTCFNSLSSVPVSPATMLAAGVFSASSAGPLSTQPRSPHSTLLRRVGRTIPAHHSFEVEFDVNKRITLHGTVTKVVWASPHVWVYLDVSDSNGSAVNWAIQAAAPSVLATRGWRRSSVLPGMFITIDAFLARDGTATVNGRDVTLPDGRKLCANIPCKCCRLPGAQATGQ